MEQRQFGRWLNLAVDAADPWFHAFEVKCMAVRRR